VITIAISSGIAVPALVPGTAALELGISTPAVDLMSRSDTLVSDTVGAIRAMNAVPVAPVVNALNRALARVCDRAGAPVY
jgi:hypothetical protein